MTDYPTKCPCDSCRFKKQNFAGSPKKCPNFAHFFEVYMDAIDGILNTENCEQWEGEVTNHCEGCPECVVLFDDGGYHGSVPDSHSVTCKGCPHRRVNE